MKVIKFIAIIAVVVGVSACNESKKEAGDKAVKSEKKVAKSQTMCPVMNQAVSAKSQYVDVKGKRIYVCCGKCIDMIKANPDKYIKKLEEQGVVLAVPTK